MVKILWLNATDYVDQVIWHAIGKLYFNQIRHLSHLSLPAQLIDSVIAIKNILGHLYLVKGHLWNISKMCHIWWDHKHYLKQSALLDMVYNYKPKQESIVYSFYQQVLYLSLH